MTYIREAFEAICTEAVRTGRFYVSLIEEVPFYGGPEEGGWWGSDSVVVAYQEFSTLEAAELAKSMVETLARELETDAEREYGEMCLNSLEWLESRGLEADYLPEPDGPSKFWVIVSENIPVNNYDARHYE